MNEIDLQALTLAGPTGKPGTRPTSCMTTRQPTIDVENSLQLIKSDSVFLKSAQKSSKFRPRSGFRLRRNFQNYLHRNLYKNCKKISS